MLGRKLPFAEYDDDDDHSRQSHFYRELEWIRIDKNRKPGWTAFTFKELFGVWPERWMQTLMPCEPRAELLRWLRSRDNAFKKEKRDEREKLSGDVAKVA